MLVTLSGIVIFAKLSQYEKIPSPILVIPFGIDMLVKLVQYSKA